MNGVQMGDEIVAALQALNLNGQEANGPNTAKLVWEAVGAAIVAHIQANSLVTTTSGAPNGEHTGVVT